MKNIFKITAAILALATLVGCGSKIKKSDSTPTAEMIEVTKMPAAEPAKNTQEPAVEEQKAESQESQQHKAEPENAPAQDSEPAISRAEAEKLVLEATGATGLKVVSVGSAYVFDCYNGNDYMGTVEVNAETGELTYQ